MALTVSKIMTEHVVTLSPEASVQDAIKAFTEHTFRHLPVVDHAGKLLGILSDRDVLRAAARTAATDARRPVRADAVMTRDVRTGTPDMTIATAVQIVVFLRVNSLPIVDETGRLRGIVTTTDLLSALYDTQPIDDGRVATPAAR
jgi:acetoin utilization protein AcuB